MATKPRLSAFLPATIDVKAVGPCLYYGR